MVGALQVADKLAHQVTVRGHHHAVYCVAFDRTGRLLVTGSDDHVVKVKLHRICKEAVPFAARRYPPSFVLLSNILCLWVTVP
jgi:WD40 repeat protein